MGSTGIHLYTDKLVGGGRMAPEDLRTGRSHGARMAVTGMHVGTRKIQKGGERTHDIFPTKNLITLSP